MKHSLLFLSLLLCFFSCMQQQELPKNATDKQKIIYDVIRRSLTQRSMPAFYDLKGQKTIYVHDRYLNFINQAATDARPLIDESDIPKKVKGLPVKLITEEDLKKRAAETGFDEFMLVIGNITIEGNTATIGIDGWYESPEKNRGAKMSGGGGIARYSKEKGIWAFKGFTQTWIS